MAEEIRQIFQWNIEYYQSQCFGKCLTEANLYGVRNQMRNLLFANLQITTTLLRFNEDWTKRLRMMGSIWGGFKGGIVKQPKTTNSLMTQRIILDSESCMQGNLHVQFGGGENSVRNLPIPTCALADSHVILVRFQMGEPFRPSLTLTASPEKVKWEAKGNGA
jgi:hypothetical protein